MKLAKFLIKHSQQMYHISDLESFAKFLIFVVESNQSLYLRNFKEQLFDNSRLYFYWITSEISIEMSVFIILKAAAHVWNRYDKYK